MIQGNLFYNKPNDAEPFKFIDLFCGIGGFRVAAGALGGTCVFSSDINPAACKIYQDNFKEDCYCDITKKDLSAIPSFDLLLGGFPCQPFSSIGRKEGFKSLKGQLIYYIIEILKIHQPKYFLLENVANLLNMPEYKTILSILTEAGYDVYTHHINSNKFVPTHRNRIYFCGFRKDLNIKSFELIIPNINKIEWFDSTEVDEDFIIKSNKLFKEKELLLKKKINKFGVMIANKFFIYRLINKNEDVPTIVHRYRSSPIFVQEGDVIRLLTKQEARKCMGFPEWFNMDRYSTMSICQLFGNSVTPPVIEFILRHQLSK